jgi:hypothetical protein
VVRDVFEEGWQGCKSGLQVSTTGGPFFDEYPRQGGVFTTSNSSTPDAERFVQVCSYQCSRLLASASVSGQKLLTFQVIYHFP